MSTIEQDLLARINTLLLWQPYLERTNTMLNAAAARGFFYVALVGVRTLEQQAALYAIGRTTGKIGHIVTKAPPGKSAHHYYCGIDYGLDADRAQPGLQYDEVDEHYRVLAEEAHRVGLEAGFYWNAEGRIGFRDPPHVQAPLREWGVTWEQLETAQREGGRLAVIAVLDAAASW